MTRILTVVSVVVGVVLGGVGLWYGYAKMQGAQSVVLTPVPVSYRHIVEQVDMFGTTKAAETIDLAFKNNGIVEAVLVNVGDSVTTTTPLIVLRSSTVKDQLAQAQAQFDAESARLRELLRGTRPEQIAVASAQVTDAQTAFTNAQKALLKVIASAQSMTDTVIRVTIDQFIQNPSFTHSSFTILIVDQQTSIQTLSARRNLQPQLISWRSRITALQTGSVDALLDATDDMHDYIQVIAGILDNLTTFLASGDPTQSAAAQSAVTTARTALTGIDRTLDEAYSAVRSTQAAVTVAERELDLLLSGPTHEARQAQEAAVAHARELVAELKDTLSDQTLVAPLSGTVASIEPNVGEAVGAGATVLSLIATGPLKLEGYVPEVHSNKIVVGQRVSIMLDAFPGESFTGTLRSIDPTATPQDSVPNFKVTVYFDPFDAHIRPGLTASAHIQVADKPSVLAIPLAAVAGAGKSATVNLLQNDMPVRTHVETGSVGVDGYVEIVSGLREGDVVLVDETKDYKVIPNQ
ncbi:MAG: efflux RND transporter periplasmic adaptor subunit [Patescibacteria group bacterium]